MLVTSDRERLFLLKLINLGRIKFFTIVNVIYSTLIGVLWHYVLEREQKTSLVCAYVFLFFGSSKWSSEMVWVIGQLSLFDTALRFIIHLLILGVPKLKTT